ncbi:MAG TPA: response regulator transcription factor [Mariprofundaceae bacterium]|nr:response regulator transcription factor [Mariprofundaceae bacterium]
MSPPLRIQIVDDHEVVRTGFRYLLEEDGSMQVVVESTSGKQACRDFEQYLPDIVIMDISLPDISGLETMRRILLDHPLANILILSMHTGMVAERALQMGARGYVCKSSGARALLAAIEQVMLGARHLDPEAGVEMPADTNRLDSQKLLTKRELEVCMRLARGQSVGEIANSLHLSEKTVYTHRQHIMDKLGVTTTIELARVATLMGILP